MAIAQSKAVNGVTWHYNKVDATHVRIIGAAGYFDTLNIPSSIKVANADLTIVEIGANAFSATNDAYATALQSVTIPSSVLRIGASAFSGCNSLTNVAIHDSVDSIGAGAFSGCVNLSRMTILGHRSLLVHPDEFTESWISRAAVLGVDGLYIHPVGGKKAVETLDSLLLLLENPEFRARIDHAREKGLEVAYEMHAGSWLLPRALYDEHPEYFRMDASGKRCRETNFCFSNPAAMDIAAHRAVLLARRLYGSSHRYFFWLDDTKNGGCCCEACRIYSASDQQLLFANRIVAELRKTIPDAQLGYLAYYDTVERPTKVKPAEGIFLEFAPYTRSFVTPIADQQDKLEALKGLFDVFGKRHSRILEYWFDNSLFSHYKKPPKQFRPINEIVRNDIAYYRDMGFEDVASFACYLGDDYEWLWGSPDVSAFAKTTKLESGVFSGCASLKDVKISNGVTNIPDRAFAGCCGLTSVTIPGSVTSIGDCAFSDTSLATVHVAKGDAARIKSLLDGSGYDTGGVKFVEAVWHLSCGLMDSACGQTFFSCGQR